MAFELKQSLKLTQQLLMTPQLQQAIKLLQLSRMELEQFVTTQLAENPCLEEGITESPEEVMQAERERERTEEQVISEQMQEAGSIVDDVRGADKDIDWEAMTRFGEHAPQTSSSTSKKSGDDDQPNYENMVTKASSLGDHLMTQVGELDFDDEERRIASLLIGNIDERGYLMMSVDDLVAAEGLDKEKVEDILDTIQRFDPPGVGARDLKECLHLQLRNAYLRNGIVEKIVENHLPELENRNFVAIAKAMKISLEQVIENVAVIAELEPVPGRQFGQSDTQYVTPDVYVFKLGNDWVVTLNEDGMPKLKVSGFYTQMAEDKKGTKGDESRNYINEKLKSAEWLIKSIRQRQRTIFRVTESIVARQKDFFEQGVEHLHPMILKDIAEDIGMHESTISRVTNNKYVHTPRGVFELKYFFNSSVTRSDGGADVASESVKRMIADLIKAEDARRPLSDQRIVELLEEKGIQLARRTVAKYREQLQILPSSKRKKYF